MHVPFYGQDFPDGWTPRVCALLGAISGRDVDGADIAVEDLVSGPEARSDVQSMAGLLWAALAAAWGLDPDSEEMGTALRAVLAAAGQQGG